ncbi:MAG: ATP-binding protein [Gammaproteobacteria bacterium]|nr:ATP-binding protein [Gammaproteobacteria bacterium]
MISFSLVRPDVKRGVCLASEYTDVIKLWTLRTICLLPNIKRKHSSFRHSGDITSDREILEAMDMLELENSDIKARALKRKIYSVLDEVEQKKDLAIGGVLEANLTLLQQHLDLHHSDILILAFLTLVEMNPGMRSAVDTLGEISGDGLIKTVASILDIDRVDIRRSLSRDGILIQAGLLKFDRDGPNEIYRKLDLLDDLSDSLLSQHDNIYDMLNGYLSRGKNSELDKVDFDYLDSQTQVLSQQIEKVWDTRSKGTNILVYGPPGTGKSEYVRLLAQTLEANFYEINTEDSDGDSLAGYNRFRSYQLVQRLIARHQKALVIFDEIEDVFPRQSFSFFGRATHKSAGKAWVNRLLEDNPIPAIWISNSVGELDPAYLRRFDQVIKMDTPPLSVRRRILDKSLSTLNVSPQWTERVSENAALAPAIVTRAAKVVAMTAGASDQNVIEGRLEQLIGSTMEAMGYSDILFNRQLSPLDYHLEYLNTDIDIESLVSGLAKNPVGRFCLYGAPGTGKTEFGRYVAKAMDKPLLVKRASDLLSMYVGEAEKNIAAMFKEAQRDDAVLLLDEADSFLQDRKGAHNSWEVTQVNELLTQMEAFEGLFICSTNLMDNLDAAALRRFDFKIKFDYLGRDQAWSLFNRLLEAHGDKVQIDASHRKVLDGIRNLAPGDFAVIARQQRLFNKPLTPDVLLERLMDESDFKSDGDKQAMGFTAKIH